MKIKKMEIVYVGPEKLHHLRYGSSYGFPTIEGFPIESVRILGQGINKQGFIELVKHFEGVFDNCTYHFCFIKKRMDRAFSNFMDESELDPSEVNPVELADLDNRLITYKNLISITASLKSGDDCAGLDLILDKEALKRSYETADPHSVGIWWKGAFQRFDKSKPSYLFASAGLPYAVDKLIMVMHQHYVIDAKVIEQADSEARDALIQRLGIKVKGTLAPIGNPGRIPGRILDYQI